MSTSFQRVLPSSSDARTIFDMSKEEIKWVEKRMYPGKLSSVGFLAKGEKLAQVCYADVITLDRLGISCDHIGESLKSLIERAQKIAIANLSDDAVVGEKFKVSGFHDITKGFQECPFSIAGKRACHIGRGDLKITNLSTNESISFSPLCIDLILDHAFFQGDTPYRLDPEKLCRVVELIPDADLKKKRVEVKSWSYLSTDNMHPWDDYEHVAQQHALNIIEIDPFAKAYICSFPYFYGLRDRNVKKRKIDNPTYCHIFNRKYRWEALKPVVNGVQIQEPIRFENSVHSFVLKTSSKMVRD